MRLDQHPDYDATVDAMLESGDLLHDPRESWGDTTSDTWRLLQEIAEEKTREDLELWFCRERSLRFHLEREMKVAMRLMTVERGRGRRDATEPVRGNLAAYARLYRLIEDARRSGRKTLRVETLIDAIREGTTE